MIKNYLLISLRNLAKNKVFILINIFGMSIAIGCCIVGYYNWDFNASFDNNQVNAKEIYRVNMVRKFQNELTEYGIVPLPMPDVVKQNIADVDQTVSYYRQWGADFKIGEDIFSADVEYVGDEFFNVFTFKFLEGRPEDIKDKTKLFISTVQAEKFFGKESALGKPLALLLPGEVLKEFIVGGVFQVPKPNSSFGGAEVIVNYQNYLDQEPELGNGTKWNHRTTLFLRIKNPDRVASITKQLQPYIENNNKVREDFIISSYKLDPLIGMGDRDQSGGRDGVWTHSAAPTSAVVGTGVMAILILLIACFNLTNTAISVSSRRLKEIGIRKVLGGLRSQLVIQFLGETMLICFVSLAIGMVLTEFFFIPQFNSLWPFMKIATNYTGDPRFLLFMIGVLIFTGLVAGAYPAFYVTRFQPIAILKGKMKFGDAGFFTQVLLFLQYGISLLAIVCSFAFLGNAKYQRDFDLGFNQKTTIYSWVPSGNDYEIYKNALSGNDKIISIAGSKHNFFSSWYNDPIKSESREIETDIMETGDNYLKTVGMSVIDGRDFRKDSETDMKESVIISEKFAKSLGWDRPIGKKITWLDTVNFYVIGVVKDTYTRGLWREVQPMMIRYSPVKDYHFIVVSAEAKNIVDVNKFMEAKWKATFPNKKYNGNYMDQGMAEALNINNNIVKMFVFLGIVALMLSATGLYTLVSLNILKRMKEIGVRKVFGASVTNISRIINTRFVIILLLASAFGSYTGSLLAGLLMRSIWKYYQTTTPFAIAASVLILFAISIMAIGWKVYSAAKMNPVKTLREE